MCSVQIDTSRLGERANRNNQHYFRSAAQFIEDAMTHSRLEGTVKLRPKCHLTSGATSQAQIELSRPLKFSYQPSGNGSAWEYEINCTTGLTLKDLYHAISAEIDSRKPLQKIARVNNDPEVKPATVNTNGTAVHATTNGKVIESNSTAVVAGAAVAPALAAAAVIAPDGSSSLIGLMSDVMNSAIKIEEMRREIVDKRKLLAQLRDEEKRISDKAKAMEDEIAGLELKIEGDPEARRASAFLDVMATLVKSRQ